jgi:hypothetical protein
MPRRNWFLHTIFTNGKYAKQLCNQHTQMALGDYLEIMVL